jgi:hypothetical protein
MFSPRMEHLIVTIFYSLSLVYFLSVLLPFLKILKRTGHNPAWCILGLFPFLNVVCLWIFAFKAWPIDARMQNTHPRPAPRPTVQDAH